MNEKIKMMNQEIIRVRNKMQEINTISYKLEDTSLPLEEKLALTALKKEKVEELRNICKLNLEKSESESKSESKLITREDGIKYQKNRIEQLKAQMEQYKRNNDISWLNLTVYELERAKVELEFLEECPDTTPTIYTDFLGREHLKKIKWDLYRKCRENYFEKLDFLDMKY